MKLKTFKLIKTWKTKVGLNATIIMNWHGYHCGYVDIRPNSFFYKKSYRQVAPQILTTKIKEDVIGKRGVADLLCCAYDKQTNIGILFDVHGGITFSGEHYWIKLKSNDDTWSFGFDCAHLHDNPHPIYGSEVLFQHDGIFRDENYVIEECESLAKQIINFETLLLTNEELK